MCNAWIGKGAQGKREQFSDFAGLQMQFTRSLR
jgi:hypothetical protein